MTVEHKLILKLVCLLAIVSNSGTLSLPLSALTHDAAVQTSEKENTTKQEEIQWQGNDLKTALCSDSNNTYLYRDVDVKCTDSDGVYLSIGHCLTYHGNKDGTRY